MQVLIEERQLALNNGNEIVAEGRVGDLDIKPPKPPSFEMAVDSSHHYIGFHKHQFPTCFVCGPDRNEGEGLRIFAGPVPGREMVAAPWIPGKELADSNGLVRSEFLWAAMDCPGYFAIAGHHPNAMLLGRMSARIVERVPIGTKVIVTSSKIGQEGRKANAITALHSENGTLLSYARSVWIEISPHLAPRTD